MTDLKIYMKSDIIVIKRFLAYLQFLKVVGWPPNLLAREPEWQDEHECPL